jgi:cold shock CspA family protein/ribosome-associated translation inhibitor RaiA
MQMPLEIAFHNLDPIPWAEGEIRGRVARLERLFGRLIGCRVRVDQRAQNSNGTIPPVVRIEISVPGHKDIVVAHEPDHLQRKYQDPDLLDAIHDAFRIAERRLVDWKERVQGETKIAHHDGQRQLLGQVAELDPERDHGFLLTANGGLLYFHRNSLLSGEFDALRRGDEVHYVEDVGDTGPIATKVRVKEKTSA